ncbi:MAG: DUF255 domain-containing protein [Bacteroidetes bacterium]|nr:DUF255 domain-containing protein [Bacteroidota bacterium]
MILKDFTRISGIFIVSLLFLTTPIFSQPMMDSVVKWKSIEEVKLLMKTEPRPIFTFFYSPGDDSSAYMLDHALNRKEICSFLNSRFYPVKLDINTKDTIQWFDNKAYPCKPYAAYNDLVLHLLGKKPATPAILIYNKESAGFTFKGYENRYELRCILVYFSEDVYKTTPYELWSKAYKVAFPPMGTPNPLKSPIHWKSLKQALALQKTKPKSLFINWYARLNVSSFVMLYNTFEDPKLAKYLNEHFYCVSLDAQTKDTLYWGRPYRYEPAKSRFNQLAVEQLQDNMKFPALAFFDSSRKMIVLQQSYLGPLNLFALANYAGSGSYKSMKLKEYLKKFNVDF